MKYRRKYVTCKKASLHLGRASHNGTLFDLQPRRAAPFCAYKYDITYPYST